MRSSAARRSSGGATSRSGGSGANSGGKSLLEKTKVPATAIGAAALVGAAGLAAAQSGKRNSKLLGGRNSKLGLPKPKSGIKLPKPDLKKGLENVSLPKLDSSTIDWVEEKAKGVGDAGYRVAEMTGQARRVRKAITGDE